VGVEVDATQLTEEEVEPGTAGQAIVRDLDIVDVFWSIAFALEHPAPYYKSEMIWSFSG